MQSAENVIVDYQNSSMSGIGCVAVCSLANFYWHNICLNKA